MNAEIIVEAIKFAVEWTESQTRDQQIEKLASELSEVSAKLDVVQRQLGQLILREVRAAFDALQDAKRTTNAATATARLQFAEESLLRSTRLDPSMALDGFAAIAIMAMAHQGLAAICALRQDRSLAKRHLLRMFLVNPRMARTELNPPLFDTLFRPKCADIYEEYERRDSERRSRREKRAKTRLDPFSEVPTALEIVLASVQLTALGGGAIGDIIGAGIDRRWREDELDKRCRTVATELLGIDSGESKIP